MLRAQGNGAAADTALRALLTCSTTSLAFLGDDDRLLLLGASRDSLVRAEAFAAGERIIDQHPDDLMTRFNLALGMGQVRPSLAINGLEGDRASALLDVNRPGFRGGSHL